MSMIVFLKAFIDSLPTTSHYFIHKILDILIWRLPCCRTSEIEFLWIWEGICTTQCLKGSNPCHNVTPTYSQSLLELCLRVFHWVFHWPKSQWGKPAKPPGRRHFWNMPNGHLKWTWFTTVTWLCNRKMELSLPLTPFCINQASVKLHF